MRGAKQEATPPTSVQTRHHFSPEASLDEGGAIAAEHLLLNEGNPDGPCGSWYLVRVRVGFRARVRVRVRARVGAGVSGQGQG